jgi:hypothetical protein
MKTMKPEDYIKFEIQKILDNDRKRGKRRDEALLTDILTTLFWTKPSPERDKFSIFANLKPRHPKLELDSLMDNLEALSKLGDPKFVTVSSNRDDIDQKMAPLPHNQKGGRPRNVYKLNDCYITGYYSREQQCEAKLTTAIACNRIPCECGFCDPARPERQ